MLVEISIKLHFDVLKQSEAANSNRSDILLTWRFKLSSWTENLFCKQIDWWKRNLIIYSA